MVAPLLITLREGLEAALIIGIVLAYLVRTGNGHRTAPIWAGTAAAVLVSVIAAVAIFLTVGELEGAAEQIFEGSAMLLAVVMLIYMVIWMKRQSSSIRGDLQGKVQAALRSGSGLALAAMAFLVVVREGVETALFLFASSRSSTASAAHLRRARVGRQLAAGREVRYGHFPDGAGGLQRRPVPPGGGRLHILPGPGPLRLPQTLRQGRGPPRREAAGRLTATG